MITADNGNISLKTCDILGGTSLAFYCNIMFDKETININSYKR